MDNFRRHSNRRQKPTFIDGFISPNSAKDSTLDAPKSNLRRSRSYSNVGKKSIDDFKDQPDGFHPRKAGGELMPDGRSTGRRPSYKKAIDMDLSDMDDDKKPKKKRFNGRVALKAFSCLLIISVLLGGYLFGKGYLRARQVFGGGGSAAVLSDEVDPSKLKGEGDGRINVLLLARGGAGHDGADLTDTILIASIDPIQKEAGLLSIPRDLYVKTDRGGSMKINAVFATAKQNALAKGQSVPDAEKAGFEAIQKKTSEVAGIPINYYAMVDFAGFSQAIDTVGGVTIDVKEPLYDQVLATENRGNPLIAKAGVQTMGGKQALLYAQSRYGSARGDFDRNQRQREVLVALKDKIFTVGTFGNPVKISQLMDNFGSHIQTNFNIDEIMQMYNLGKQIDSSKITSVGLADPPQELVGTANVGGLSVVVPKAGTYDYSAIHSFVRNTLKDGFIKKEDPRIIVLNGTTKSGMATAKAEELRSYGYNVVKVEDAPTKNYTSNLLVDMRNGAKKYTKRYLELRFKTSATTKLPEGINPEDADFVIIVGQNGTIEN